MFGGDVLETCRAGSSSTEDELCTARVKEGQVRDYSGGNVRGHGWETGAEV